MAIAVSVTAGPVLRRSSESAGLALVALAVAGFVLQIADTGALMSILALSHERAGLAPAQAGLLDTLGAVVGAGRRWMHYTYLLVAVNWILLLNAVLFRFRLVPRPLAALGVVACLLQLAAVSVPGLLGIRPATALAIPLAPVYLSLGGWLMTKGLGERTP